MKETGYKKNKPRSSHITKKTAQSDFLSRMSHEIRTPVQSIIGALELLETEDIPDKASSFVNIANHAANDLLTLLDDILDYAKIDAERLELDHLEIPLRLLVNGVVEALSIRALKKSLSLTAKIDDDVPIIIQADPKRLRQILLNLVNNALKFTHHGSVVIHVSARDGKLRFSVSDTGIGMTEQQMARLFRPFMQADETISNLYGGTGLGLSIFRGLVDLMKGEIGVESKPEQGSVFWFTIPLIAGSGKDNTDEWPDLTGLSILVVEDHPQGAREITTTLSLMGAMTTCTASVSQAVDILKQKRFDIAVIDYALPDGTGVDVLQKTSEIVNQMGIVFYTVHNDFALRRSLKRRGVYYLEKPASRLGLGRAVASVSNRRRKTVKGPSRVLIVDDTESMREIISAQCARLGIEVEVSESADEALEKIRQSSFHLIVTDLHMRGMNGAEFARVVRENGNLSLPLVLLTADIQVTQSEYYRTLGFDECLLKPVTLMHLRRLFMRWGLMEDESNSVSESQEFIEKEQNKPISIKHLMSNFGAVDAGVLDLLESYVFMTRHRRTELAHILNTHRTEEIKEFAHSLKGAALSAAAIEMAEFSDRLDNDSALAQNKEETLKEFDSVIARFEKHLKTLRDELK